MRRTSTRSLSTLGASSAASIATAPSCRTSTEDTLDIDGDRGDSDVDVEGDEFELHMNANETEYYIEDDAITGEGNVERGAHKNFLKVTARGSMEVIGKIAVDNSMSFEGVKIPSTPDDYVPSAVNTIKGEPDFESMDNMGQWSRYCYRPKFNSKGGKKCVHHALPTGAIPVPANEEGKRKCGAWGFNYAGWKNADK